MNQNVKGTSLDIVGMVKSADTSITMKYVTNKNELFLTMKEDTSKGPGVSITCKGGTRPVISRVLNYTMEFMFLEIIDEIQSGSRKKKNNIFIWIIISTHSFGHSYFHTSRNTSHLI
jgi:hypothetical protein